MVTGAIAQSVFGIENSFSGKRWLERPYEPREAMGLAQQFDFPEIIGRLLSSRGIAADGVQAYLDPKLSNLLPDPFHLLGMSEAVTRLIAAVTYGHKIAVFGDYDVDGATSSALIYRYFRAIGKDVRIYIPDRLKEGYGPTIPAMNQLKSEGIDLIITVDCGTAAHDPLSYAKQQGLDVVVVDHHVAEASLPDAIAVINPNRLDEESPHRQLAAVGVTFLLIVAMNRALREATYYSRNDISEPDLMQWLDLVALGTVADVVPLTGVNRALVSQGLKVLARRQNAGLVALGDVANLNELPNAYHLGFIFGPRVNAGGRVGESHYGAHLLSTEDQTEANQLAVKLDRYNQERQNIETQVFDEALQLADVQRGHSIVMVAGNGWHPGVVGIVASRLKERFGVPSCVLAINDEKATGSGRSIPGVDLGSTIIAARQQGIILAGGGHAMAAGFSLATSHMDEFREFVEKRISDSILERDIRPTITVDGTLTVAASTLDLVQSIARLGPFGSGNTEPRFAFSGIRIVRADVVGKDHVRCQLIGSGGQRLQAIAFRSVDTHLGQRLLNHGGLPIHLVGRLHKNIWQGNSSVQLLIDDGAEAK